VRKLCDNHEALLIFDEIPTGLGKTGKKFSCEHTGVRPDITVLGKALGGGVVPVAAVILRSGLDCAPELSLGHYTHEKNPFCARAALTTLQIIEDEQLVDRAAELGVHASARVELMRKRQPLVKRLRGRGLLFAIELHAAKSTKPRRNIVESIFWRALDKGINLSASEGRDLSITAPLIISKDELIRGLDVVEEAIAEEWAELKTSES
jgi:4-aminobutyrate aminotransferase